MTSYSPDLAYAVGYYYGRAVGDMDPLREELGDAVWWEYGGSAKAGYDRGVGDHVEIDVEPEEEQ